MDRSELKERLMATFLGELEEHARTLEANALALEKDSGAGRVEILKTLFRTAHSLKGASRSAGVSLIEATCHRLEELLAGADEGSVPVSAELVQMLLSTADALGDAGRRLRAKEDLADGPLGGVLAWMGRPAPSSAPADPPEGPPLRAPTPRADTPAVAAAPPKPPAPSAPTALVDGVVRIPAARLDALVSRSGELLVARRRSARRRDDVEEILGTMAECLAEWRRLERPLRALIAPKSGADGGGRPGFEAPEQPRPLPRRAALAAQRTTKTLKKLEQDLERLARRIAADQHALDHASRPFEEELRRVRMLPFGEACEGLERAVRDLAKSAGKEVSFVVEGADVELDRAILAGLRDPLLHLVRNAVDHGIEPAWERRALGKPERGRVVVSASLEGEGVEVVVADDGRGLDLEAIRAQARRRKLAVPEDDRELVRLVFSPGFSTSRLITELSGRGIGLDVVKHSAEVLHGRVDAWFEPDRGTRFVLALPLTLTTLRVLLVEAAGEIFALPTAHVQRLVRAGAADLASIEGREMLVGGPSPTLVVSLAEVLGLPAGEPARVGGKIPLVVVSSGERQVAFAVDELAAEQDVVVKSLGKRLRRVRHVAGATALPTGRLALILAAVELVEAALGRAPTRPLAASLEARRETARRRLLVADDSITTRSLERSILEAAGYDVVTAADGAEAWQMLQDAGADLVVTDVEMPRMDGFALTEAIRGSKRFRDLPVVLVTALETERDKARGLAVGADAYLQKSAFDQRMLLQVIAQLL
jgi:two-component system chemotaxis sensor kinase CheA